jgi:spore coat protein U-like protein
MSDAHLEFNCRLACKYGLNRFRRQLGALLLSCASFSAHAACTVTSSGLAFGTYNYIVAAPTDITANIQVSCFFLVSLNLSYDILLSQGASASYVTRKMNSAASELQYNLYTSAAHSTVWGDGNGGSAKVTDGYLLTLLSTVVRNYTVYGRIPAGQNVAAGVYNDVITVTVNY